MPEPLRAAGLFVMVLCLACASAHAQSESNTKAVPSYKALPEAWQHAVLLGEPRSSKQIEDSPFGIMTTICMEGGPAEYRERAAVEIGAAGYKWVSEYLQLSWKPEQAPQLSDAAKWSRLSERCMDYLSRLQAQNIHVLMRLDPLPTRMLRGGEPASEADLELATTYTRAVVQQLKGFVKHWQLGNEPNVTNAPEGYVKVAAALARAIRAEQPDAVIYGPAVAMLQCMAKEPYPWVQNALKAGLLEHIDVFSFHPYRANGDEPERASEFARFRHWPTYASQLDALRNMLKTQAGHALKLAVSEDGESSAISADGEQRITAIIDAKNELRRALLDMSEGIYPRIHFAFFRNLPDADYSHEGSFNVVNSHLDKKPIYYAAQNLHAVLDSSYSKSERIRVNLQSVSPNSQVQTYVKHQAGFDELLVFFWAGVPAQNTHLRVPLRLDVAGSEWKAPVLIDLMTMPGRAKSTGHEPSTHQRVSFPVAHKTQAGVQIEGLELRDNPQLLKLIRPSGAPQHTVNAGN